MTEEASDGPDLAFIDPADRDKIREVLSRAYREAIETGDWKRAHVADGLYRMIPPGDGDASVRTTS
jgi:hypothetical protein